jgi:hypothetical protein
MDNRAALRDTGAVPWPGFSRQRLARTLNAAYAEGLLSEETLMYRLDTQFASRVVDPARLVGDLPRRSRLFELQTTLTRAVESTVKWLGVGAIEEPMLLALDWHGAQQELLIGRHPSCDVVLAHPTVSRHHARLVFRDGTWVLQDLESTNGTLVNHRRVGRYQLRPGDTILFGDQPVQVD